MERRTLLKGAILFIPAGGVLRSVARAAPAEPADKPGDTSNDKPGDKYDPASHYYGMGIEIEKCIGCGLCIQACKDENDVPREPFFCRTWVERYTIKKDDTVVVESIEQNRNPRKGEARSTHTVNEAEIQRTFFVPKLCNQCENPPCVQVCPVAATYTTPDGVILVDTERCIGCRYCIQACPYGARYLHPRTRVADKCTFCYHRIVQGLLPACVEICPTQARVFGDLRSKASQLVRFRRMKQIAVLKPHLNTQPKVYYAGLDGEVR